MGNLLLYTIVGIGCSLLGAGLCFLTLSFYQSWNAKKVQAKLIKDMNLEVKEGKIIIPKKDGKPDYSLFEDGGKDELSEKEVEEDERQRQKRFREYEKLRHAIATTGGQKHGSGKSDSNAERNDIQDSTDSEFKLHKPTAL